MKILLFDMDGVLLEPRGYQRALRATVAQVGRLLGYEAVDFTLDDIATFEAVGVIDEWDSAAICAALLLENLWDAHPALGLPAALDAPAHATHDTPPPDFRAFARSLARLPGLPPLERAERLLLQGAANRTETQNRALRAILRQARQVERSLTHRVFQELVLGGRTFAQTYNLPPSLDVESYLIAHDRPALSEGERAGLLAWLEHVDHRAAIFTARPSLSPDGQAGTPEAEIGARGVGLEALPLIGLGGLAWLGARRGCNVQGLQKPSPVHTLTALRLALGDALEDALAAAAALALDNQVDRAWETLRSADVYVFEDTTPGLRSISVAKKLLAGLDVSINVSLFGITESEAKRRALKAVGATVVPSLSVALEQVPGFAPQPIEPVSH